MYVSHILTDVKNLGPGKRLCVWFAGCSKNCPGCCSPELQTVKNAAQIKAEELADLVNFRAAATGADGITLSGGDPLEQPDIVAFLSRLYCPDILLFTGFDASEIRDNGLLEQISEYVAVLKCGRYISEKDEGHPLMGSTNQELIFLNPSLRDLYEAYIAEHNRKLCYYRLNHMVYFSGLPDHHKKAKELNAHAE